MKTGDLTNTMNFDKFLSKFGKKKKKEPKAPDKESNQTTTTVPQSIAVVAIDFGTTYSGWAYSFKTDYESNPRRISIKNWTGGNMISQKGPTSILIKQDGRTTDCFGYEAELNYSRICENGSQNEWFFFKRFKMMLHREKGIDRNRLLEDYTGKKLPALTVFALSIQYLKDDVLRQFNNTVAGTQLEVKYIHWVLTVPAIWNDAAKQFMREAANRAGIPNESLSICLEPEAASIYCCHLPVTVELGGEAAVFLGQFEEGTQYMILDAGGGTVDITVHEKTSHGQLKEIFKASGDAWGGTKVDAEFESFLGYNLGQEVMSCFREHLEDHMELFSSFEIKKRMDSGETQDVSIRLPLTLFDTCLEKRGKSLESLIKESIYRYKNVSVKADKMRISAEVFEEFFEPAITSIVEYVSSLLKEELLRNCSAIVMVGGFSTSYLLQKRVKESFPNLIVIIPDDTDLVVLKGAVIFGHEPRSIIERVCKYTYGTKVSHRYERRSCTHKETSRVRIAGDLRCQNIFDIHAKIGQSVRLDEEQEERSYRPVRADQSDLKIEIYASSSEQPELVTEEGCRKIGEYEIPNPDTTPGTGMEIGVRFIFGGTEIRVKVTDKASGQVYFASADFLG